MKRLFHAALLTAAVSATTATAATTAAASSREPKCTLAHVVCPKVKPTRPPRPPRCIVTTVRDRSGSIHKVRICG